MLRALFREPNVERLFEVVAIVGLRLLDHALAVFQGQVILGIGPPVVQSQLERKEVDFFLLLVVVDEIESRAKRNVPRNGPVIVFKPHIVLVQRHGCKPLEERMDLFEIDGRVLHSVDEGEK